MIPGVRAFRLSLIGALCATVVLPAAPYKRIVLPPDSHPAAKSAAAILAGKLGLPVADAGSAGPGDIFLATDSRPSQTDGYKITFQHGAATVVGARPRSLLYAAGDVDQWKDRTTTYIREPSFAIRTATYDPTRSVAAYVAQLGVNILITRTNPSVVTLEKTLPEVFALLSPEQQSRLRESRAAQLAANQKLAQQAHDADVTIYAFLYGNDPTGWSRPLYDAALAATRR